MTTIKIQGNASGGGNVILTAPNTSATRTITLPDGDVSLGLAVVNAWATYEMHGTASLVASAGVSSLSDLGTGTPQFNLSTALSAANGTIWNTAGRYESGQEYAVQSGGLITSTTAYKAYCAGDTTPRRDWDLGYTGIIR